MLVGRDIEVDCRRRLDVRSFSSSLPRLGLRTSVGRESGGDRREGSASGADAQLAIPRAPGRIGDECRSRKCHIPTRNLHAGLAGGRLPRSGTVRISSYFRFLNSSLRPLSGNERFCDSRHSPAAARLCASRTRARNQRRTTRRIRGFYNDSGAERPQACSRPHRRPAAASAGRCLLTAASIAQRRPWRPAQPLCLLLRIRGGRGGSAASPYGPRRYGPAGRCAYRATTAICRSANRKVIVAT
jgi:hypothetical protein